MFDPAAGLFRLSTLALRTSLNATTACVLVSNYGGVGYGICSAGGPIPVEISGLGAGTKSFVRVGDLGYLERVETPDTADDVVGRCDASGFLHASFGSIGPIGPPATPVGQGLVAAWQGVGGLDPALFVPATDVPLDPSIAIAVAYAKYAATPAAAADVAAALAMGAYTVFTIDASGIPYAAIVQPGSQISFDGSGFIVETLRGNATDRNIRAQHKRYNRVPTSGSPTSALTTADAGKFGEKDVISFAAGAAPVVVTLPWRDTSRAEFDLRAVFTSGTAIRRIDSTSTAKKTAGVLTVATPVGPTGSLDALATVNTAVTSVANAVTITFTPNAAATECSWSLDGNILKAV